MRREFNSMMTKMNTVVFHEIGHEKFQDIVHTRTPFGKLGRVDRTEEQPMPTAREQHNTRRLTVVSVLSSAQLLEKRRVKAFLLFAATERTEIVQ